MLCLGLLFCLFVSHSVWFVLNQISSKNKGTNAIILKFTLAMLIKKQHTSTCTSVSTVP